MSPARIQQCFVSLWMATFASDVAMAFAFSSNNKNPRLETTLHASSSSSRRDALLGILSTATSLILLAPANPSLAAETIGKAADCNDSFCLGVWDGLLADCPHNGGKLGAGCVCSQDDTPGIFSEPWDYSEAPTNDSLDYKDQMDLLVPAIEFVSSKRGDTVEVQLEEGRYLRVQFTDHKSGETSIGEFYFTPNDTTVQYRIASIGGSSSSSLASLKNMERGELIRKQLRYLKIPVLRNRSRSLFFGESELDTFGPGSAMLGPPAEMTSGEIEQGRGSDNVDPKLKIDLVQQFPRVR